MSSGFTGLRRILHLDRLVQVPPYDVDRHDDGLAEHDADNHRTGANLVGYVIVLHGLLVEESIRFVGLAVDLATASAAREQRDAEQQGCNDGFGLHDGVSQSGLGRNVKAFLPDSTMGWANVWGTLEMGRTAVRGESIRLWGSRGGTVIQGHSIVIVPTNGRKIAPACQRSVARSDEGRVRQALVDHCMVCALAPTDRPFVALFPYRSEPCRPDG